MEPFLHTSEEPRDNKLNTVRESSHFNNFEAQHPSQKNAAEGMMRLAQGIVRAKDRILNEALPFKTGRIIVLSGKPGRGKSHLMEAFINHVIEAAPELKEKMFLLRKELVLYTYSLGSSEALFGNRPIAVIDDLFREHNSIDKLGTANELPCLARLINDVYDHRRLLIMATNFPFLNGIGGALTRFDTVGRIGSRLSELMASSRECVIEGDDYRSTIAQRSKDPFAIE